ncbi:hypothetical protein PR048_016730 [Dryococelus australis]|uniref:Uncharacterized protein n=1 Tax=Dryococelus australis TaxID=614101 RepID=A0ABQ9H7G5_9NEOP|nr:hypothetical protein PR048_016730 [Dryococelus australis]
MAVQWSDYSPPTQANMVPFSADFRMFPLVCGSSRGSPVSPALAFRRCAPHSSHFTPSSALKTSMYAAVCKTRSSQITDPCSKPVMSIYNLQSAKPANRWPTAGIQPAPLLVPKVPHLRLSTLPVGLARRQATESSPAPAMSPSCSERVILLQLEERSVLKRSRRTRRIKERAPPPLSLFHSTLSSSGDSLCLNLQQEGASSSLPPRWPFSLSPLCLTSLSYRLAETFSLFAPDEKLRCPPGAKSLGPLLRIEFNPFDRSRTDQEHFSGKGGIPVLAPASGLVHSNGHDFSYRLFTKISKKYGNQRKKLQKYINLPYPEAKTLKRHNSPDNSAEHLDSKEQRYTCLFFEIVDRIRSSEPFHQTALFPGINVGRNGCRPPRLVGWSPVVNSHVPSTPPPPPTHRPTNRLAERSSYHSHTFLPRDTQCRSLLGRGWGAGAVAPPTAPFERKVIRKGEGGRPSNCNQEIELPFPVASLIDLGPLPSHLGGHLAVLLQPRRAVRPLASHLGEPGSIPGGVFSGSPISPAPSFRYCSINLASPTSALKTSMLRASQISSLFTDKEREIRPTVPTKFVLNSVIQVNSSCTLFRRPNRPDVWLGGGGATRHCDANGEMWMYRGEGERGKGGGLWSRSSLEWQMSLTTSVYALHLPLASPGSCPASRLELSSTSICCRAHNFQAVAERLARSPPTMANRVQSPAGSQDFRKWDTCLTMPLFGGFSRGSPISPASPIPVPLHIHSNHTHWLSRPRC